MLRRSESLAFWSRLLRLCMGASGQRQSEARNFGGAGFVSGSRSIRNKKTWGSQKCPGYSAFWTCVIHFQFTFQSPGDFAINLQPQKRSQWRNQVDLLVVSSTVPGDLEMGIPELPQRYLPSGASNHHATMLPLKMVLNIMEETGRNCKVFYWLWPHQDLIRSVNF
jgi:hypothetical protein